MTEDAFLELEYGKLYTLDLHGETVEEARADLIHTINSLDIFFKGILIIHGFHKGITLRKFVRENFKHKNIYRIVKLDAARTIYLLDMEIK